MADTDSGKLAPPPEAPDPQALRAPPSPAPAPSAGPGRPSAPSVGACRGIDRPGSRRRSPPALTETSAAVPDRRVAAAAPVTEPEHTATAAKGALVQLAAVSSEAAAKIEWQRLQKRMPDLLDRRQPAISKIEHDGHILWRVRTGGFSRRRPGHRVLRARARQGRRLLGRRLLKSADRRPIAGIDRMKAAIVGIAGPGCRQEAALFRAHPPAGVILFARNIQDPRSFGTLIAALRRVLPPARC